jgi:regulator of sirC expression with transglutaminase-like and TPR domain
MNLFFRSVETSTAILDAARREALLSLLDDKSAAVRSALLAYFAGLGPDAAPFLREVAHGRNRVLGRHAAWYLEELKFSDPVAEFRSFIRSLNYELETGALLLARTVTPQLDVGRCCYALDSMATRCRELFAEPSSLRDKCRVLNRVMFHEWGFRGHAEHYTDPRNSLLDQVINRRKGSPITLSLIYLLVAARLGLEFEPVGLPGHFFVGCYGGDDVFFIDVFDQGVLRDAPEIFDLLRAKQLAPKASDLAPMPVREVLARSCRHLATQYSACGEMDRARMFASFVEDFEAAYTRNVT